MEFIINSNTIIAIAGVLTALGGIFGVVAWCVRFVDRNKEQDKELAAQDKELEAQREEWQKELAGQRDEWKKELEKIRDELTIICYGQLACLKGLKEQGCDGPVTTALDKLEKHLNQAAHDE